MTNHNKPKTSSPTKQVSDFTVSSDVQRIMGMKANPEGFDPKVDQPISDPKARSYAERIKQRTAAKRAAAAAVKGKAPPLGHVEAPDSEKMEAIANFGKAPSPQKAFEDDSQVPQKPSTEGVGSSYAVNQAVSRGDTNRRPVTLKEGNQMPREHQGLSEGSLQALRMATENAQKASEHEHEEPEQGKPDEEDFNDHQEMGEPHTPQVAGSTKEELDDMEDDLAPDIPPMDFGAIRDARTRLLDPKRRKAIEARLKELNISDMVMKQELQQNIPIIPGKLEVTLRTFTQRENLWILRYIFDYPGSPLYTQELINTCRLVCSIVAINGAYLPDHRKNAGSSTEEIIKEDFERKLHHVASFPVQLVADLSVQAMWFQDRVDKLFTIDELKNG